jgi:hypothetical protein
VVPRSLAGASGIDLQETRKQGAAFAHIVINPTEHDGIHYWAEAKQFHLACGPENLSEAIEIFVQWFEEIDPSSGQRKET